MLFSRHVAYSADLFLYHNFRVTEGFKEAAEKFAVEAGFKAPAELERLDERIKIRDAIQAGKIQEATALVNQLHPDLLDSDRYLFFHLQQQHLIELIRQKNIEEALRFAQVSCKKNTTLTL